MRFLKPGTVRLAMDNAIRRSLPIADIVPEPILDANDLVSRTFAIERVHLPESLADVAPARRRLIFDSVARGLSQFPTSR